MDDQAIVSVGADQTIRLWSCADGLSLRILDNHVGTVNGVAVQPASTHQIVDVIATISEDRTVRIWQPRIGRLIRFTRLVSVPRCLVWSTDAKKLYVGCNDGRVRILDAESMEITDELDGLVGRIHELAIEPVGGRVLTAGEQSANIAEELRR